MIVFDVSNASGPHLPNRKIAHVQRFFFKELNDKCAYCVNGSTEIKLNVWLNEKCLFVKCNSDTLLFNQTFVFGGCVTVKERYNLPSFTLLKSVFETVFTWRHRRPSNVVTLLQSNAISCDKTALTKINKMMRINATELTEDMSRYR